MGKLGRGMVLDHDELDYQLALKNQIQENNDNDDDYSDNNNVSEFKAWVNKGKLTRREQLAVWKVWNLKLEVKSK